MTTNRALIEITWAIADREDITGFAIDHIADEPHQWRDALCAALQAESLETTGTLGIDAEGIIEIDGERVRWAHTNGYSEWALED